MHYLHAHKDFIEVAIAGTTGFTVLLTETELILKVLIAIATLGFIIYKWVKEVKKK